MIECVVLQAIKDLPTLCKEPQSKNLSKIVDVLTQLLQVMRGWFVLCTMI